ncbi:FtsX-like permease family protein [Bacteroides sp.]|uniref:FtsX-like permease family protein n=1 Tax=Bacteroides sp. TaxID=29523 RepID=UPI00352907CD
MNKKLLKQIVNERRSNAWLFVELLLVSIVLWYVVDYMFVTLYTYFEPRGFDIENTYRVEFNYLTEKSPDYIAGRTEEENNADIRELLDRLRRRPGVEAVSMSQNSFPYNGSNSGMEVRLDTMERKYNIRRWVTPDFFRVFRYRGANGETPEQLGALLKEGTFMASSNLFESRYHIDLKDYIGKEFCLDQDTARGIKLSAALEVIRYDDFSAACYSRSVVILLREDQLAYGNEICLRTSDGEPAGFAERLMKDAPSQYRVGNVFLSKVNSFQNIRRTFQLDDMNTLRNYLVGMGFLLLNIFLGLLGTFWFRTQQRKGEMALMMAVGGSKQSIFLRLLSEGWFMLLLVTPLAFGIDFYIAKSELTPSWYFSTFSMGRFILCESITLLLMALMILAGIWFPARQSMKIQPAEALHEE